MKNTTGILLVMGIIFLISTAGCTPRKQEAPLPVVKLQGIARNSSIEQASDDSNLSLMNASNASQMDEGIRIRRLSNEEVAYRKRNTEAYEALREEMYSTKIDLTKVDAYNCKFMIEELEKQLDVLAIRIGRIDDDLDGKEQDVARTKEAYEETLSSNDPFEMKTKRFDYNDAENEYDEVRKESREAHDEYDETERTERIVELKCTQLRAEAGLKE